MAGRFPATNGIVAAGMCRWALVCWGVYVLCPPASAQNPPLAAPRLGPIERPSPAPHPADRPGDCPQDVRQFIASKLFSLTLQEQFANRWVATETTDEGPVRDRMLGAEVVGTQLTRARTELDFVSCTEVARMFLHLRGTTMNRTTSWTPQAVIQSEGNYRFQLSKQIDFDGLKIGTRSPAAFLETRQRNLSACTPNSGVPVVGPLINMVVFYAAEQQRPLAERIAAFRLTQSLAPQFNDAVDLELAHLNKQLDALRSAGLAALTSGAAVFSVRTTEDRMQAGFGAAAPDITPMPPFEDAPLLVALNQEFVNRLVEEFALEDQEFSDTTLDRFLHDPFNLRQDGSADDPEQVVPPTFAMVRLSGPRPLTARIQHGTVELTAIVGFRPVLGPEIPPQRIVLEFSPKLDGETCAIDARLVEVTSADPVADGRVGELTAALLKQQIQQRLGPMRVPRSFTVPGSRGGKGIRLTQLVAADGWLVLGWDGDAVVSAAPNDPTSSVTR